jgi:hypothetical protein
VASQRDVSDVAPFLTRAQVVAVAVEFLWEFLAAVKHVMATSRGTAVVPQRGFAVAKSCNGRNLYLGVSGSNFDQTN